MALSVVEIRFFAMAMGIMPSQVHILELGECQTNPVNAAGELLSLLLSTIPTERLAEAQQRMVSAEDSHSRYQRTFGPARAICHTIFDPASYTVLDLDLGPRCFCLDLNGSVDLHLPYDCVIANGTSEYLFDQSQRVPHHPLPRRSPPRARQISRFIGRRVRAPPCEWSWHDDPALDAAGASNGEITGYYGFHTDVEATVVDGRSGGAADDY